MQSRLIFAMHVKKLKSKYFTMSIWGGIRVANMGYAVYAVPRGATRRGGCQCAKNKSLKIVFNKAF